MSGIDNYQGVQYTQDDYNRAIARLRQVNPLHDSGWLIGHRIDGSIVYLPGSYMAGYRSVLFGNVSIVSEYLGLVAQLSDGTLAYLPVFSTGVHDAKQDLQNAIFIEAHRRELSEIAALKQREQERDQREHERMQRDVQEKRELQKQLDELREKLSKRDTDKNSSKSNG